MARSQRFAGLAPVLHTDVRACDLSARRPGETPGPILRVLSAWALKGAGFRNNRQGRLWVPARAEPVIGRAFARPVGLAGTTVVGYCGLRASPPISHRRWPSPAAPDPPRAAARRRAPPRCRLPAILP